MLFKKLVMVNVVPVILSLGLVYCNSPSSPPSNLKITSADAEKVLKLRLDKTQEVRRQLKKIIKALSSTEVMMSAVYHQIQAGLQMGSNEKENPLGFLARFKTQLKEFADEMVIYQPDGSWMMTKRLDSVHELSLIGATVEGIEQIALFHTDLGTGETVALANLSGSVQSVRLSFVPNAVETLTRGQYRLDACELNVASKETTLTCLPFVVAAGGRSLEVNRLNYALADQGTMLDFAARLGFGGEKADISMQFTPERGWESSILLDEKGPAQDEAVAQ